MLLRPILSRICKHQRFANFCILKNVGQSLESSENGSSPSSSTDKSQEKGYVISYLVNSCGLSPEKAISASRKVHFDSPDKPNAVLNFLGKRGFSKTQIADLVRRHSQVLVCNPKKSISPKIEFLLHFTEMSETDVLRTFTRSPDLFARRLEHRIIPVYDYLKDIIGARKVGALLKRGSWVFSNNLGNRFIPNVDFLKELGVPKPCIQLALYNFPEIFSLQNLEFRAIVEEVKLMGFDPSKSVFVCAIHVRTGKRSRATWDRCYEVYSKWGWSKDDIPLWHSESILIVCFCPRRKSQHPLIS